jgi:hypothetical protein
MPTIKQQAILTLQSLAFTEVQPGKWGHPQFHNGSKPLYVYIGRSHSLRRGTTKADSVPIAPSVLRTMIERSRHQEPLAKPEKERSVLTELRRDLHGMIGTMSEEECRVAIETVQNLRDRERRRAQLKATHNDRESSLQSTPINAIARQ